LRLGPPVLAGAGAKQGEVVRRPPLSDKSERRTADGGDGQEGRKSPAVGLLGRVHGRQPVAGGV